MAIQINSMSDLRIRLREERMRLGLGQDQIPGLGRTTVIAFENGTVGGARMDTVFAILSALGGRISLELGAPVQDLVWAEEDGIDLGGQQAGDDDIDLPEPG